MPAFFVRPQYGPTLPELIVPRWRRSSRASRGAIVALGAIALALAVAVTVLWPRQRHFSRDRPVPFSFDYAATLKRVAGAPGAYVTLEQRRHGRLLQSLAVRPLTLPAFAGQPEGALPVFASGYVQRLARTRPAFVFLGEGKTRIDTIPAYYVLYQFASSGRTVFAHDNLIVPDRDGSRAGVIIELRATPASGVKAAAGVGIVGPLLDAQKSFQFAG